MKTKILLISFLILCSKNIKAQAFVQVPKDYAVNIMNKMYVYVQIDSNKFFVDTQYLNLFPNELMLQNKNFWIVVDTNSLIHYDASDTSKLDSILKQK